MTNVTDFFEKNLVIEFLIISMV